MSRVLVLRRYPKRTLGVLGTALAAVSVAVGSGASFTSSSSNPSNVFTSGTLHHTNTPSGDLASTTVSGIKPGFGTTGGNSDAVDQSSSSAGYGKVVINNDGSLAGDFTVGPTESGTAYSGTSPAPSAVCGGTCSALDGALKVKITETDSSGGGAVTVYDGLVSGLAAANLGSGSGNSFTLNAGVTRTYEAYFYLPKSTGNAYQGGSATVGLAFDEAQH
jgi:spore coat-associated protein N